MDANEALEAIERLYVESANAEEFMTNAGHILFQWRPENWTWA